MLQRGMMFSVRVSAVVTVLLVVLAAQVDQFTGQTQNDEGTLVLPIHVKVVRELRMKHFHRNGMC